MMKAEALRRNMEENTDIMREKMKMMRMKSLFQQEEAIESKDGVTGRRRGTLSEVENGQGSRHGSMLKQYLSPRI
jgi:hypothetical protein